MAPHTADAVRDAAVSSSVPLRLLRPATRTLADLYIDSIEAEGRPCRSRPLAGAGERQREREHDGPASQRNYGEIFDRGYLHYDGPRLGIPAAIWALARYSMARAIGIRRPWTAKIIPMLIYAAVLIPVALAIGIRAFVPAFNFLSYGEFFGAIFILEGIFVALIAPEMVSTDRHDKMLPLYFSRPIGRTPMCWPSCWARAC